MREHLRSMLLLPIFCVLMALFVASGVWMAWDRPSDTAGWGGIIVGASGITIYFRSTGARRRNRVLAAIAAFYALAGLAGSVGFWLMFFRHREFHSTLLVITSMALSLFLVVDAPFILRDAACARNDDPVSKDD